MSAANVTAPPPVFVVKFLGGIADKQLRIARARVPQEIVFIDRDGGVQELYLYAGEQPQTRQVTKFDPVRKANFCENIVEAIYHIFRPADTPAISAQG